MRFHKISLVLSFLSVLLTAAHSVAAQQRTEVTVSAAASLKNVLAELSRGFEAAHPTIKLRFNYGGSGTLQRQIEQGAPVDLFISAAEKNMDALAAKRLIDRSSRHVIARNLLVIIVPAAEHSAVASFTDLGRPGVRRVAIGDPKFVPAGQYAQEVLSKRKVWNAVRLRAVLCKDVREVLTQVELGNVDAGIVYRTDAAISPRVRVVAIAPDGLHKPIRYSAAVIANSGHAAQARQFLNYLCSSAGRGVWWRYQFLVPN